MKEKRLLFPIIVIIGIAVYTLLHENFYLVKIGIYSDFEMYYRAGLQIIENPSQLYSVVGYLYFPFFALLISPISYFFGLWEAHLILFGINILLGIYSVFLFDRLMKLLLKDKQLINSWYYSIMLTLPYFSWYIQAQFYQPQAKMITLCLLLYCVLNCLQYELKNEKIPIKKWIWLSFLLGIILSIAPHYILIIGILIFPNIEFNKLKNRETLKYTLKRISIFSIIIFLQNIWLFLYPNLIIEVFRPLFASHEPYNSIFVFYLYGVEFGFNIRFLYILYLILLVGINLFLIIKKMNFINKIIYSSISYLFFCYFGMWDEAIFFLFLYFLLFTKINYFKNIFEFSKNNLIIVLAILGVFIINLLPLSLVTYEKYFDFVPEIIFNLRYLPSIVLITIGIIYRKN